MRKKTAKRKNKTIIKAKRVVVVKNKTAKKAAKKTVKRRRNLDHKDSAHQVEVSKHWRAGGLSQWQRAHHAGQKDLFSHGIKARAKHNPTASAADSAKWEKLWKAYIKALADLDKPSKGANARAAQMRLGKAEKAIQQFDSDTYRRLVLGLKNPKRNPKGPIPTPQNQSEYKALHEEYSHWRTQAKSTVEKALLKKITSAMARYEKSLKRASAPKATTKRKSRKTLDPTLVKRYTIGKAIISIRSTPGGKYTASWTIKGVPGYQTGISPRGGLNQYLRREFSTVAEAQEAVKEYNRNPHAAKSRSSVRPAKSTRAGLSGHGRKTKSVKRVAKTRKTAKRNPTAPEIRKTFAGRYDRDEKLIFPDGTPTGLAKLGKLVSIDTDAGKIKPVKGVVWLCADTRGKLHLGTPTKGHVVFSGPAQDFGKVRQVEYMESKPHLGYPAQTIYFHKLGEETGVKPRLITDGKGGAKFVGGAYQIKREGIIN